MSGRIQRKSRLNVLSVPGASPVEIFSSGTNRSFTKLVLPQADLAMGDERAPVACLLVLEVAFGRILSLVV